jgi:fatty acid CoA ligase FadD9
MGYAPPERGELCVITDSMFTGYYNSPDQTSEALDADGFYRTGDVVWVLPKENDEDPVRIEIIDRRKNFFKLAQGVFVAPDNLESQFVGASEYISQMFIHGTGDQPYLVAVVVPHVEILAAWFRKQSGLARDASLPGGWHHTQEVRELLLKAMRGVAKAKEMRPFEVPKKVFVELDKFTTRNRLLTPSEKPCRPKLQQHYRDILLRLLHGDIMGSEPEPESRAGGSSDSHSDSDSGSDSESSESSVESGEDDGDFGGGGQTGGGEAAVRAAVIRVLSRVCGVPRAVLRKQDGEDTLRIRDLCVDSLTAVRVVRAFREHPAESLRVRVPLELIYDEDARLDSLVEFIAGRTSPISAHGDLRASARVRLGKRGDPHAESKMVATAPLTPAELEAALDEQLEALQRSVDAMTVPEDRDNANDKDEDEEGDKKVIFVTGATGFVGAFLASELAARRGDFGASSVVCLVRGRDAKQARLRLQRCLDGLSLSLTVGSEEEEEEGEEGEGEEGGTAALSVLAGDLGAPHFGLSQAAFDDLARRTAAVFHCGAYVNAVLPYGPLRAANVDGTRTCLELAFRAASLRSETGKMSSAGKKSVADNFSNSVVGFHFVSTLSVVLGQRDPPEVPDVPASDCGTAGYSQTKWVADQLVVRALGMSTAAANRPHIATDLRVAPSLFRFGNVSAHSQSGACNLGDFQTRFILGCTQLGAFPDTGAAEMTFSPANAAAETAVAVALRCQQSAADGSDAPSEHVFHVMNPNPPVTPQLVGRWIASFLHGKKGDEMRCRPAALGRWISVLRSPAGTGTSLEPLLSYFDGDRFPQDSAVPCERIMLAAPGIFEAIDERYIHRILAWLAANGSLRV